MASLETSQTCPKDVVGGMLAHDMPDDDIYGPIVTYHMLDPGVFDHVIDGETFHVLEVWKRWLCGCNTHDLAVCRQADLPAVTPRSIEEELYRSCADAQIRLISANRKNGIPPADDSWNIHSPPAPHKCDLVRCVIRDTDRVRVVEACFDLYGPDVDVNAILRHSIGDERPMLAQASFIINWRPNLPQIKTEFLPHGDPHRPLGVEGRARMRTWREQSEAATRLLGDVVQRDGFDGLHEGDVKAVAQVFQAVSWSPLQRNYKRTISMPVVGRTGSWLVVTSGIDDYPNPHFDPALPADESQVESQAIGGFRCKITASTDDDTLCQAISHLLRDHGSRGSSTPLSAERRLWGDSGVLEWYFAFVDEHGTKPPFPSTRFFSALIKNKPTGAQRDPCWSEGNSHFCSNRWAIVAPGDPWLGVLDFARSTSSHLQIPSPPVVCCEYEPEEMEGDDLLLDEDGESSDFEVLVFSASSRSDHEEVGQALHDVDHDVEHDVDHDANQDMDHDADHDMDHDADHDMDHDAYHDMDQGMNHDVDHDMEHDMDHDMEQDI